MTVGPNGDLVATSGTSKLPVIAVVIVTWNSARMLPDLLASLEAGLAGLRWHLTVADNASADDSVSIARQLAPDCRIVQTGRNAGYAAAFNSALAQANQFDAALVLNPDIRLAPNSVAAMFRRLDRHRNPKIGITVPRLLDDTGELARSLRREPTIARALGEAVFGVRAGRFAWLGETVLDDAPYHKDTVADWATGAIMLISAECLATCGPWDESFFLYSEETEFALRARDRGHLTMLVAEAEAVHIGGESGASPALWSLLTVNRVRLYRRRHKKAASAAFWAAVFLREAARALLGQPRSRQALAALIRPSTLELPNRPAWVATP